MLFKKNVKKRKPHICIKYNVVNCGQYSVVFFTGGSKCIRSMNVLLKSIHLKTANFEIENANREISFLKNFAGGHRLCKVF